MTLFVTLCTRMCYNPSLFPLLPLEAPFPTTKPKKLATYPKPHLTPSRPLSHLVPNLTYSPTLLYSHHFYRENFSSIIKPFIQHPEFL